MPLQTDQFLFKCVGLFAGFIFYEDYRTVFEETYVVLIDLLMKYDKNFFALEIERVAEK